MTQLKIILNERQMCAVEILVYWLRKWNNTETFPDLFWEATIQISIQFLFSKKKNACGKVVLLSTYTTDLISSPWAFCFLLLGHFITVTTGFLVLKSFLVFFSAYYYFYQISLMLLSYSSIFTSPMSHFIFW